MSVPGVRIPHSPLLKQMYCCKFCHKSTESKSGHSFHEKRCKLNPNRITKICKIFINDGVRVISIEENELNNYPGWKRGYLKPRFNTPGNKDKIVINNGTRHKYIERNELDQYISNGWTQGYSDDFRLSLKGKSKGVAGTDVSEELRRKKISQTMKLNPNAGGCRKGSGVGKSGWYHNIWCDSTWELAFLVYHLDHNLYIQRCKEKRKYIYNGEEHYYTPDFVTQDGIIEIKGYKTDQWLAKEAQNPDIIVLGQKDIQKYLDYMYAKYGKNFVNLYERK